MAVAVAHAVTPRLGSPRRALRIALRVIGLAVASGAAIGIVATMLFAALGLTPRIVVSGSMEPGLPIGSVVVSERVDATAVSVGDVVTTDRFNGPGTVTHRVVDVALGSSQTVLTLKGDANGGVDREPYEVREVGVMRLAIPYVGLPQLCAQDLLGIDPLT